MTAIAAASLVACTPTADGTPGETNNDAAEMTSSPALSPRFPLGEEQIDEAADAHTVKQLACIYACGAGAAAGCVAVSGACASGTVVTIGGVGIPCIVMIAAACGAVGGAGAVCGAYCVQ